MKKFCALLLALVMLIPCAFAEETAAPVFAVGELSGNFNPFFATAEGDRLLASLVNGALLTTARGGEIVRGDEAHAFHGASCDYTGLADATVAVNPDGSADYTLTLHDGARFSDGTPVSMADVIFSIYVRADADYDGPCGLGQLPIEGMEAYRGGLRRLDKLLLEAGRENRDFRLWDGSTQAAFWADVDAAGEELCRSIVDYCLETYLEDYAAAIDSTPAEINAAPALQLKLGMLLWGYGESWFEGATLADFWAALLEEYGGDVDAAQYAERVDAELWSFIEDYEQKYGVQVRTEGGADSISGVTLIDRSGSALRIHATRCDPAILPALAKCIAPLHVYGDPALYDYENNSFGFTRGDLTAVRAVKDAAVGCGAYTVEKTDESGVLLRANEHFYRGKPSIECLRLVAYDENAALEAVLRGEAALCVTELDNASMEAISTANDGAGLSGTCADVILMDAPEYVYLGANVERVQVGGAANSAASIALRRALMAVLAAQREELVANQLGDGAYGIEYPILNSSWAAPGLEDAGYESCYSRNAEGAAIYTDEMGDEARHAAALSAAVEYLKRAGYTWDEAGQRFTAAPEGASMEYACSLAEDDPAAALVQAAAEQLSQIGIALRLRTLAQDELDAALAAGSVQLWIAPQSCGGEPDLYAWYHSDGADKPSDGADTPSDGMDTPSDGADTPSDGMDTPSDSADKPSDGADAPSDGMDKPSNPFRIADAALDGHIMDYLSADDPDARRASCKAALDRAMELGCVLPLYQPCLGVVVNPSRLDCDSLPEDMTPFYGWWAEMERLEQKE